MTPERSVLWTSAATDFIQGRSGAEEIAKAMTATHDPAVALLLPVLLALKGAFDANAARKARLEALEARCVLLETVIGALQSEPPTGEAR